MKIFTLKVIFILTTIAVRSYADSNEVHYKFYDAKRSLTGVVENPVREIYCDDEDFDYPTVDSYAISVFLETKKYRAPLRGSYSTDKYWVVVSRLNHKNFTRRTVLVESIHHVEDFKPSQTIIDGEYAKLIEMGSMKSKSLEIDILKEQALNSNIQCRVRFLRPDLTKNSRTIVEGYYTPWNFDQN